MKNSYDNINKIAKEQYEKLSSKTKNDYLNKNKAIMKKMCMIYWILFIVCVLISLINFDYFLIINLCSSIPILLCIFVIYLANFVFINEKRIIISMMKKEIRRSDFEEKKRIIQDKQEENHIDYLSIVENTSDMIFKVNSLNEEYDYKGLSESLKLYHYSYYCKNIEEYNNFDFNNWLYINIKENMELYEKIIQTYEYSSMKYENYIRLYESLEKYTDISKMQREWEFERYHNMEVRLYKEKKARPVFKPSIILNLYFSPVNGGEYHKSFDCPYEKLVESVKNIDKLYSSFNYIDESEKGVNKTVSRNINDTGKAINIVTRHFDDDEGNHHKIVEQKDANGNIVKTSHTITEGKRKVKSESDLAKREESLNRRAEKLKEKEQEIKNASNAAIKRKQKELEEREAELQKKEYEFYKATKEHIYASDTASNTDETEEHDWYKLKKLKNLYETGEITYDEYVKKRKEYLED